jgi:hypothetical protein
MPDEPPKSIDVTKSGGAEPQPTTKPIIVTNRPILKDPMVKDPDGKEHQPVSATGKVVAAPAGLVDKKTPVDMPKPTSDAANKPAVKPTETPASSEKAVMDAVAAKSAGKDKPAAQTEEEAKRQAQIDKLIEEKKYFLPIGQVTKRKKNIQLLIVLGVVVAAAAAYFVLKPR